MAAVDAADTGDGSAIAISGDRVEIVGILGAITMPKLMTPQISSVNIRDLSDRLHLSMCVTHALIQTVIIDEMTQ
jgi:hypothetical protein